MLNFLRREPLAHFIALALLLFVFNHFWSSFQKEKIVVDAQTSEYLFRQREALVLHELSPEQRREVIDSFVEDEILYSEAYKRGMDRGDTRMRRNMILKMRGMLVGDLAEPTQEQLRIYFEENRPQFDFPPTLTLDQVFFSRDTQAPVDLLDRLRSGLDHESVGEPYRIWGRRLEELTAASLSGALGPEIAGKIIQIEDDSWHGPFESMFGVHFLRITGRQPSRPSTFEEIQHLLPNAWALAESRRRIESELATLSDKYEVIIEDDS